MREKRQCTDLLHLSSRMDGVAQRVEQALILGKVTKSMSGVVQGMDKALASMDAAKIATVMDKFERQFEELDVQTETMNGELERTTGSAINDAEVASMMQMVADEYGLKLAGDLAQAPMTRPVAASAKEPAAPEDELEARMRALNS
jgi:charged multivesicular body protein 1